MISRQSNRQAVEPLENRTLLSAGSPEIDYGASGVVAGPQFDKSHVLGGGYQAIAVDANERVVVGDSVVAKGRDVFYLRRFNAGGGVDKSFGSGGVVEFAIANRDLLLTGVLIESDGMIVATGTADNYHTNSGVDTTITNEVVADFTTTGRLNTAFGEGGVAMLAVGDGLAQTFATSVTAQDQNGGMVIASPNRIDRLTSTGMVDPNFTPILSSALPLTATFVSSAVDFSGDILVGLSSKSGVARYTPSGILDTTFGTAGVFTDTDMPIDRVTQILPRSDGSIILLTAHDDGTDRGVDMADLMNNGTPDTTFTGGGVTATLPEADDAYPAVSLTNQFDGKLLVVSPIMSYAENSSPNGFIVQRFNADGSVDNTFGTEGIAAFDGTVVAGRPAGAVLDNTGRLVVSAGNATLVAIDTTNKGGNFTGTIYDDHNSNRKLNAGDTGIAGATVYVDYNDNGKFDGPDFRVTTDASGLFTFPTLPVGRYVVRVDPLSGYVPTTRTYSTVTVLMDRTIGGINFGELKLGSVAGTVTAGDGTPMAGVTVFVDLRHNGRFNPKTDPSATTASDGTFSFANLSRGIYRIIEIVPAGYARTTPARSGTIAVKVGIEQAVTGLFFSNTLIPF